MKPLWIFACCALSSCLFGKTSVTFHPSEKITQTVEVELPPSNYEWELCVNYTPSIQSDEGKDTYPSSIQNDEDEGDEGIADNLLSLQCFTHREGDALEVFAITALLPIKEEPDSPNPESVNKTENESVDEFFKDLAEAIGQSVADRLRQIFPNHNIQSNFLESNETHELFEWELRDHQSDLMHGYSRLIKTDSSNIVVCYHTTELKTECNRATWLNVLNQATVTKTIQE